jgi:D-alanyl-lipoteichoic acid acyltransferase DltB (MBOAT superfamily)
VLFNSYIFVFVFLPVVLAVFSVVREHPERRWAIAWLVLASFCYYAWWKPEFILLLLVSIAVNAAFGKLLCSGRLTRARSRGYLAAGIVFNLSVLAYFKYAGFLVENLNQFLHAGLTVPSIILPIGISFITFQKIAFLVDAHRGEVRDFSLWNFALFVTFFPQLIAGPIVHHAEVMPQFSRKPLEGQFSADLAVGLSIFCVGLFKKVVIADNCAIFADAGYGALGAGRPLDFASAWIGVLAYSFQLYYDFSGYSDMAIGLARMFGVRFPVNFHSPYKASGMIEFWRRWHMTLSRFLRDYLYIPLGGGRHGLRRQALNVTVVMLLGGLWHGANWTFVLWGAVHGVLVALNHAWKQMRISGSKAFQTTTARRLGILMTFLAVTLAWVPFRAADIGDAGVMLATLFPFGPDAPSAWASLRECLHAQLSKPLDVSTWGKARELWPAELPRNFLATYKPVGLLLAAVAAATFLLPNTQQIFARFDPVLGLSPDQLQHPRSLVRLDWKIAVVISGIAIFSALHLTRVSPFLYFQF